MKLDKQLFTFVEDENNPYYKRILYNGKLLRFITPSIYCPFGIEEQYNKYIIKLQLTSSDTSVMHIKKMIEKIEKYIKELLDIDDNVFKSVILVRNNTKTLPIITTQPQFYTEYLVLRIKSHMEGNISRILTTYESKNAYDTIYDLGNRKNIKCQIELSGVWDYRNDTTHTGAKVGLIFNVIKIMDIAD